MKLLGKNMVREVPEFIPAKLKLNRYWLLAVYLLLPLLQEGRQTGNKSNPCSEAVAKPQYGFSFCGGRGDLPEICKPRSSVPTGAGVERL